MTTNNRKLTNLDYADPAYWQHDDASASSATARRNTYVAAPKSEPVTARRYPVTVDMNMPQQSIMTVDMRTSAVDRAKGFAIETHQLSVVTGILAVVVAVVGFGHPFLALGTLWTFFVWYTIVWLAAWVIHRILTPEFIALYNARMSWRYLDKWRG